MTWDIFKIFFCLFLFGSNPGALQIIGCHYHRVTFTALEMNSNSCGDEESHVGHADLKGIYGYKMEKLKIKTRRLSLA